MASDSHAQILHLLSVLPQSYSAAKRPQDGPYGVIGVGEGQLAAHMASVLIGQNFTRAGTQFVLFSPDATREANVYSELAEVAGATVRGVSTGTERGDEVQLDALIPSGALCTYHYLQYLAYATGQAKAAEAAEALLSDLAVRCSPLSENNPARDLAWQLWGRVPLLLASAEADGVCAAWQSLLARMGKTLSIVVCGHPLPFATGAFEAQHEKGDGRVALLLGDTDPMLDVTREVLETRIDEVIHVPYLGDEDTPLYAQQLAMWYFGAWVAAYVAERYGQSAGDPPTLAKAQDVLAEG